MDLIVAASLVNLGVASIPLWALLFRVWFRNAIANIPARRAWLAAAVCSAVLTVIALAWWFALPGGIQGFLIASCVAVAAALLLPPMAIRPLLHTSLIGAAWGWAVLLMIVGMIGFFVGMGGAVVATDHYVVPTNAMAPTIRGRHWTGACAVCGEPAYCTPIAEEFETEEVEVPAMRLICSRFHSTETSVIDQRVGTSDRIIAARFRKPKRWDVIVFLYPEDPSYSYVFRLVGLPGETITIQDGHVWANGKKLKPPKSLQGIEYVASYYNVVGWGSPARPAVLGDGEYFVLGDNSAASKDSRFWEFGAEGHPPYAVPEANLRGVVTHTYWPPSRWREF
jgi:signal peptidase I